MLQCVVAVTCVFSSVKHLFYTALNLVDDVMMDLSINGFRTRHDPGSRGGVEEEKARGKLDNFGVSPFFGGRVRRRLWWRGGMRSGSTYNKCSKNS